ncbi:MAG: hypothetical protein ABJB74_08790 [Gemmatimonas sp.]
MRSAQLIAYAVVVALATPIFAQQAVPIRALAPVDAKATQQFGNIFSVRQLPGGKILVNDGVRRQLTVLDNELANPRIVIDSVSEGGQSYGPRATPTIPYLGDSTLFVDAVSQALVLIDPAGKIVRVISAPKPQDIRLLGRSASGVDARGNLIYRGDFQEAAKGIATGPEQVPPTFADTVPVVRANFETRVIDTIAAMKANPPSVGQDSKTADGKPAFRFRLHPLPVIDEWAVLSDGAIAIVRGHDYHVDFIRPDGKRESAAKLPFDFKRLTDEDKQKLVDSVRASEISRRQTARLVPGSNASSTESGVRRGPQVAPVILYDIVPLKEIPDYYPPIRTGAVKADADGNMWILPTTSAQSAVGELIYDVVNNRGVMIERVRLPVGRSIAGFGRGGIVYLMSKGNDNLWILERTTVLRRK